MSGLLGIDTRRRRPASILDNPDPLEDLRERLPERPNPYGAEVTTASPSFVPLDTVDPTARMALRAGVGQTVPQTARMYQQAMDAAGWGGTMAAGRGIRAFHGSPHDFDRFRMDRIGTGEGNQSFGHGLYFAENEGVARSYRDKLSGDVTGDVNRFINTNMGYARSPEEVAERFRAYAAMPRVADPKTRAIADDPEAMRLIQRLVMEQRPYEYGRATPDDLVRVYSALDSRVNDLTRGRMYEVDLRTSPDRLLDWDAPLERQPAAVRDALARLDPDSYRPGADDYDPSELGQIVYQRLRSRLGDPGASAALREAGIPGIRYLDGGSRSAGEGSRNYVITDENLIEVLRKYGLVPGMVGGGGAAGLLGGAGESE